MAASLWHLLGGLVVRNNTIEIWKDEGIRGGETGYFKPYKFL